MLLGDLLQRLASPDCAAAAFAHLGDAALQAELDAAASRAGMPAGELVARAVEAFAATASDDDWVSLLGALSRASDPAEECLRRMIRFGLGCPREAPAAWRNELAVHAAACSPRIE